MPFEISVTRSFAAAHQLKLTDGTVEPLHGHNWRVEVTVAAEGLDSMGVVMDFHELERRVAELIDPIHNTHLNETGPFRSINPSTEHLARYIGQTLALPIGVRLARVRVWETSENLATYFP